jgi:hypothetical protein
MGPLSRVAAAQAAVMVAPLLATCGCSSIASSTWSAAGVALLWRGEFGRAEESDGGGEASAVHVSGEGALNRVWRPAVEHPTRRIYIDVCKWRTGSFINGNPPQNIRDRRIEGLIRPWSH